MSRNLPSKTALLERREERALVTEGKAVLEERRDLLAREMLQAIRRCETLAKRYREQFLLAGAALRAAILRHGYYGITAFAPGACTQPDPDWYLVNHAGVQLVQKAAKESETEAPQPPESFLVGVEFNSATRRFHALLQTAQRLAAEENNLRRLHSAFRTVRRRVNALDYVILPETEQAIREIEDGLEQMDREQMVSTLWVKRQLGEQL